MDRRYDPESSPDRSERSDAPDAPLETRLPAAVQVLALQHNAGNAAVNRMLASRSGALALARLTTAKQFHERTDPGALAVRSHRLNAVEKVLKRYEALVGEHGTAGGDEAVYKSKVALLDEVVNDCAEWLLEHAGDDQFSDRWTAVHDLRDEARHEVEGLRGRMGVVFGLKSIPGRDVTKLREKWEANDAHTALERVRGVIDHAVPNPGSKGEIEVEIDIPIAIGFVGMRVKIDADRPEDAKVKARTEIALTGGVRLASAARFKIEIGTYLEASGRDSAEVMRLISYGLMRVCRESPVLPHEVTNALWGGSSGSRGFAGAEGFGAAVEREAFGKNKDAFVEAGFFGAGAAEGGLENFGKGKVTAMVGGGDRWDANAIRNIAEQKNEWTSHKKAHLTVVISNKQPQDDAEIQAVVDEMAQAKQPVSFAVVKKIVRKVKAGKDYSQAAVRQIVEDFAPEGTRTGLGVEADTEKAAAQERGEHVVNLRVGGEVDFGGLGTCGLKFESHWMSTGRDEAAATHFRECKLEGRAGLKIPMNKQADAPMLITEGIDKTFTKITELVQAVRGWQGKRGKVPAAAVATGLGTSVLEDIALFAVQGSGEIPMDKLSMGFKASEPFKAGFSGATTFFLQIDGKWKAKPKPDDPTPYEFNIALAEEKGVKGELPGGFGRVSAKTTQRFLRLQKKHDKAWAVEWLGATFGGQ